MKYLFGQNDMLSSFDYVASYFHANIPLCISLGEGHPLPQPAINKRDDNT